MKKMNVYCLQFYVRLGPESPLNDNKGKGEGGGGGVFYFSYRCPLPCIRKSSYLKPENNDSRFQEQKLHVCTQGSYFFWGGEIGERFLFYFFHSECVLIMFPSSFKWVPNKLPNFLMCFITCSQITNVILISPLQVSHWK